MCFSRRTNACVYTYWYLDQRSLFPTRLSRLHRSHSKRLHLQQQPCARIYVHRASRPSSRSRVYFCDGIARHCSAYFSLFLTSTLAASMLRGNRPGSSCLRVLRVGRCFSSSARIALRRHMATSLLAAHCSTRRQLVQASCQWAPTVTGGGSQAIQQPMCPEKKFAPQRERQLRALHPRLHQVCMCACRPAPGGCRASPHDTSTRDLQKDLQDAPSIRSGDSDSGSGSNTGSDEMASTGEQPGSKSFWGFRLTRDDLVTVAGAILISAGIRTCAADMTAVHIGGEPDMFQALMLSSCCT